MLLSFFYGPNQKNEKGIWQNRFTIVKLISWKAAAFSTCEGPMHRCLLHNSQTLGLSLPGKLSPLFVTKFVLKVAKFSTLQVAHSKKGDRKRAFDFSFLKLHHQRSKSGVS